VSNNKFFVSVFTKEDPDNVNVSLTDWMYKSPMEERLCSIEITEGTVVKQLDRLKDDKAAETDELATFLNSIKGGISYPLTLLFQKIMQNAVMLMLFQFLRVEIGVHLQLNSTEQVITDAGVN